MIGAAMVKALRRPPPAASGLSPKARTRLVAQLRECVEARGGEVSARTRASQLADAYLALGTGGRHEFLRLVALEFGPDPQAVDAAHAAYQAAVGTPGQWDAEAVLRSALRSSRIRLLTQFNAIPQGIRFLVDLRTDLLGFLEHDAELAVLDRELEMLLTAWFDVGFLELTRITWDSSAALLEKLIAYEAVHEIRSWADLKNRLDSDRRLYAFFHPRMPTEPLIFVEVALTDRLADNIQALLDETAPVFDPRLADTAIFYSISNTQTGLRGVSFGNFLLKRVIDDLRRDFPRLKTFATLSPLPQLAGWVRRHAETLSAVGSPLDAAALSAGEWARDAKQARALRDPLLRLAGRYLLNAKQADGKAPGAATERPYDAVSRFHLANGARLERINYLADTSAKGLKQSFGLMVNYFYDLGELEENVEAYTATGHIATTASVRRCARD